MSNPIQYTIEENDDAISIRLEGDLDDQSFLPVSQALAERPLDRPVKVDLAKVKHVDSSGLRGLVLLQRRAREAGVEFWLIHPSASVNRIFQVTGLSQVFKIESDGNSAPS